MTTPSPSSSLAPVAANKLLTRPRSGSLPMAHPSSRAPATSSSLRLEVLPDDQAPSATSTSSSASSLSSPSLPLRSAPRSGSSTLTAPSKLRHVTSHSTLSSTSSVGRSRSGSITSPRPPNLSLLAPPSSSNTPIPTSDSTSASSLAVPVQGRPRSGSAAPVLSNNSFQKKSNYSDNEEADLARTQLSLSLDKGPPQSIDTWDPIIPDIMVHDEDAPHSSNQVISAEDSHNQQSHDEEEEKIVSAYQILNLIIPDISEAAAAAEAAEQQELEQQQQQQQENEQGQLATTSQSSTATILSDQAGNNSNNTGEKSMSEYLKANATSATDYLAISTLGIGAGLIPPAASGASARSGIPPPPISNSSAVFNLPNSNSSGGAIATPPATLSSRFRLPFSSRAFNPPSRPASVHQLNQPVGEGTFAGQEGNLEMNHPMQSSTNLGNMGSGIRSSFFDYRLTNLLQFAGSSVAPSVRSFDPNRTMGDGSNDENRQEFYEVEFNQPPDPAMEEAMRYDHTTLGRIRKVFRSGFPGRDLDPKTRKPRYKYPTNNIKTTKYTLLTFLPVNLLFQVK
ncbi:hypothetical protein FBU30_001199 [Linnemannia zychae]|nr:hypothetical protein FBU30_001199 [Linnemannia zychae]